MISYCHDQGNSIYFFKNEEFGKSCKEYLAKFLELPNSIPDSDTFRRVFEKRNPPELSSCLINWISVERERRSVMAIDGKTICSSGNPQHKAYHVICAFVTKNQITLEERTVREKTNKITAVLKLLDLIDYRRFHCNNGCHELPDIHEFADTMRKHWSIENQLHWCFDVIFCEDVLRARKDNSSLNLHILWKTILNLVSQVQYERVSKKD